MKIIKQIGIIFAICWISEVIAYFLPLPIPSSIIGLIILLLFLLFGVLKIEHIQEKSDFLLSNMAFFFVPAGVGLINYLDILKSNLLPLITICVLSTIITFAATAYSIKLTLKLMNRRNES